MSKSDKIIFGSVLVAFFPFLFALIAIAIGFYFSEEKNMKYFFISGIIAGIALDLVLVKKILPVLFDVPFWAFAIFFILCSVFIFGMFMGLPVPELIMGPAAGYYWGRRIDIKVITSPEKENLTKKVSFFTSLIMLLICISSAFLALNEKTIGEELQGMLRLNFIPGKWLIITGIITGGTILIISQYLLTRVILIKTSKSGSRF